MLTKDTKIVVRRFAIRKGDMGDLKALVVKKREDPKEKEGITQAKIGWGADEGCSLEMQAAEFTRVRLEPSDPKTIQRTLEV